MKGIFKFLNRIVKGEQRPLLEFNRYFVQTIEHFFHLNKIHLKIEMHFSSINIFFSVLSSR